MTQKANVVLIVLDDLGFADLGCYGSSIATPALDSLAAHGLRYTNFHVTAICRATRACLLTGRNHHAVGMAGGVIAPYPGYTVQMPKSAGMLPRHLRDHGFATCAIGKWHLAPPHEEGPTGPFERWPLGVGFERYYGFVRGMTDQWAPQLVRDNSYVDDSETEDPNYHLTEDLADQAIRFVQDLRHADASRPFFLYFATGAVHSPLQVPQPWISQYHGVFDGGWDDLRASRFECQLELGIAPEGTVLTDRPPWIPSWSDLSTRDRKVHARQMETYAGFLSHTDHQIGRLISFLEQTGDLERTAIFVVSDNGASGDAGVDGYVSPSARDMSSMHEQIDELGGRRSYAHYGWGWAWAGNTPFRLWKSYTWLGGVRAPMIVRAPQFIPAEQEGSIRRQFCHAIDVMPTVLGLGGVTARRSIDGIRQLPIPGKSFEATFTEAEAPAPRRTQYFEMMGSRSIYHDGWKATTDHVRAGDEQIAGSRTYAADKWTLFDLREDFSEARDLALKEAGLLRRLEARWWREARANQVPPLLDTGVDVDISQEPSVPKTYLPGGADHPASAANWFPDQGCDPTRWH